MSTVGLEDSVDEALNYLNWEEINSRGRNTYVELIEEFWRQPPETAMDSYCDYEVTSVYIFMESMLDMSDLTKFKLPILARGAVEEIRKVDQLEQDEQLELKEFFATLPLLSDK